jgi:hypothetical protein
LNIFQHFRIFIASATLRETPNRSDLRTFAGLKSASIQSLCGFA